MARFFIDRPIFAWVVALFISVAGIIAIKQLPVAYYPQVAPPAISITATYPGATPAMVEQSVISIIENELNGVDNLLYMESASESYGRGQITLTFEPGTDPDLAQVEVQNQLARATPRLPQAVNQQGIIVDKTNANILMIAIFTSQDPEFGEIQMGDYVSRYVLPEVQRVNGVGSANLYGTEHAMRVWLDMDKLVGLDLTPEDVNRAIAEQNAEVSSGSVGDRPNLSDQQLTAMVVVDGQLTNVDAFGNIVLRANRDGSTVRLRDVARIELGAKQYTRIARSDGAGAAVGIAVQTAPGSNAVDTALAVRAKLDELAQFTPDGVRYHVPLDTSLFISISIEKVVVTLVEAVILVFVVMLLFLQNIRYTLIPTLVVPVALLGTFALLYGFGFSINVLTMFAMVLVIGILVDDAIVVVENVERLMAQEGLSPREATIKAMGQITGAIVGITVVLVSVFVPMAFFSGSVGNIYRQFSVTMAVSILFSAFLALSLTPALCATLLKPLRSDHHETKVGLFRWFNLLFNRSAAGYQGMVSKVVARTGRYLLLYLLIVGIVALMFIRLPTSFLPEEDQGQLFAVMQMPAGATANRSLEVVKQVEAYFLSQPEVDNITTVVGINFFTTGQNTANSFIKLKPWDERKGREHSAAAITERAQAALAEIREGMIITLTPPSIPELGTGAGFTFRLQDRGNLGHEAMAEATAKLLGLAAQEPSIGTMRVEGAPDAPQLRVDIDRDKAYALGVGFSSINSMLSAAIGSSYVNDFPIDGRMQRVIVQADMAHRMQAEQLLAMRVRNVQGDLVPLSAFATTRWETGAVLLARYNGYPAVRLAGTAAEGYSTGDAMAALEKIMDQLPRQSSLEWHAASREEKESQGQMPLLLALSMLAVFLSLAALYESWSIPFSVMLVVPLGVFGSLLGATLAGMPNDVYFKVGLIAIIGLSAKNAILIIEFARSLQQEGKGLIDATLTACRLRFRPILMTSLAFIMGVMPLVLATGAGSAGQRAVGTGVMGGMISATLLAIFLVPVFFIAVRRVFKEPGSGNREG
ncbi:MAG: efflux RND transporter permease subunit [Porticoccaceae bacterium]